MSAEPQAEAPPRERAPNAPKDRTRLAAVTLNVSAALYILVGAVLALVPLAWDPATEPAYETRAIVLWFLAFLCVALATLAVVLGVALRRHRRWAWVTAIALFTIYVPSLFLPLGAIGLFALLSEGTRTRFPAAIRDTVRRRG